MIRKIDKNDTKNSVDNETTSICKKLKNYWKRELKLRKWKTLKKKRKSMKWFIKLKTSEWIESILKWKWLKTQERSLRNHYLKNLKKSMCKKKKYQNLKSEKEIWHFDEICMHKEFLLRKLWVINKFTIK